MRFGGGEREGEGFRFDDVVASRFGQPVTKGLFEQCGLLLLEQVITNNQNNRVLRFLGTVKVILDSAQSICRVQI